MKRVDGQFDDGNVTVVQTPPSDFLDVFEIPLDEAYRQVYNTHLLTAVSAVSDLVAGSDVPFSLFRNTYLSLESITDLDLPPEHSLISRATQLKEQLGQHEAYVLVLSLERDVVNLIDTLRQTEETISSNGSALGGLAPVYRDLCVLMDMELPDTLRGAVYNLEMELVHHDDLSQITLPIYEARHIDELIEDGLAIVEFTEISLALNTLEMETFPEELRTLVSELRGRLVNHPVAHLAAAQAYHDAVLSREHDLDQFETVYHNLISIQDADDMPDALLTQARDLLGEMESYVGILRDHAMIPGELEEYRQRVTPRRSVLDLNHSDPVVDRLREIAELAYLPKNLRHKTRSILENYIRGPRQVNGGRRNQPPLPARSTPFAGYLQSRADVVDRVRRGISFSGMRKGMVVEVTISGTLPSPNGDDRMRYTATLPDGNQLTIRHPGHGLDVGSRTSVKILHTYGKGWFGKLSSGEGIG